MDKRTACMRALIVLALLFVGGCSGGSAEMPYAVMLEQIQAGNVNNVKFSSSRAWVELKQPLVQAEPETSTATKFSVAMPSGQTEELVKYLQREEVTFQIIED